MTAGSTGSQEPLPEREEERPGLGVLVALGGVVLMGLGSRAVHPLMARVFEFPPRVLDLTDGFVLVWVFVGSYVGVHVARAQRPVLLGAKLGSIVAAGLVIADLVLTTFFQSDHSRALREHLLLYPAMIVMGAGMGALGGALVWGGRMDRAKKEGR